MSHYVQTHRAGAGCLFVDTDSSLSLQKAAIGGILFPQSPKLASFVTVYHLCVMMIETVDADGSFH